MRKKNRLLWLNYSILILLAVIFIFPVAVTVINSFSYSQATTPGLLPDNFSFKQYYQLFVENYTYLKFFWNSVFYAVIITVISIVISLPIGFCFAKFKFPFCDTIFFIYILVMMLPFQATLLPNYIALRDFDLLNTPYALIIPMIFSPFAVFLLRQFIKKVPNELIEYAKLETSSVIKIFKVAVIPSIKPAIVALSILIFAESFNMVEQPLIFIQNLDITPLSVMLNGLPSNVGFAGATVYLMPLVILFSFFRDTIEKSVEDFRW